MSDVEHIATKIRRDAPYKAPETRAGWVAAYLAAYGAPLLDALRALPADEREDMRLEAAALLASEREAP